MFPERKDDFESYIPSHIKYPFVSLCDDRRLCPEIGRVLHAIVCPEILGTGSMGYIRNIHQISATDDQRAYHPLGFGIYKIRTKACIV
jgi:hypothetical protein